MNKFYELIGLENLNKDGLRDDIIHYTTFDENGVHEKCIIRLNPIEAFTMKMRLLRFNLKYDTRIGLIPAKGALQLLILFASYGKRHLISALFKIREKNMD